MRHIKPITYPTQKENLADEFSELFHPVSGLFPPMSDAEFAELKADIQAHGQREPIWRYRGQIIDGRHRYRACDELGYEPWYKDYSGEDDEPSLIAFVVSHNLKRRHLDTSGRAMVAARLANLGEGRPQKNSANLPSLSQAKSGQLLSVSERTVRAASKVQRSGAPALRSAVESGKVAVSTAASIADAPLKEQKKIVTLDEKEIVALAKQIKERKKQERKATARKTLEAHAAAFTLETTTPTPTLTIYHKDARTLSAFISPDVDLVFTSPPYNVKMGYRTHNDAMEKAQYVELLTDVFNACFTVMRPGARIGVNVPFGVGRDPYIPFVPLIFEILTGGGFTLIGQTIWDKGQPVVRGSTAWGSYASPTAPRFRDRCEAIVWAYKDEPKLELHGAPLIDADTFVTLSQDYWAVPPASHPLHPAVFSAQLAENAIRFFGYAGCHVLDPFAGLGTVGQAAKELGVRCSLVEIDAAYCRIMQQRLEVPKRKGK